MKYIIVLILMFLNVAFNNECDQSHPNWHKLTQYSGCLERPILMVHGINANMNTWGAMEAGKTCQNPQVIPYKVLVEGSDGNSELRQQFGWFNCDFLDREDSPEQSCEKKDVFAQVICDNGWKSPIETENYSYSKYGYPQSGSDGYMDALYLEEELINLWKGRVYEELNPFPWKNGYVREYSVNSGAKLLAQYYNVSQEYFFSTSENFLHEGINHNGLEFFNSIYSYAIDNSLDYVGKPDPFARPDKTLPDEVTWNPNLKKYEEGQTSQLYYRLIAVMDEYYSDWRTNIARKIDLVGHSQGGLVIRNLIKSYPSVSVSNPVNHIRSIVTLNTPHLGTAIATDNSGVPVVQDIREYVYSMGNTGFTMAGGRIFGITKLGPYYINPPNLTGKIGYSFTDYNKNGEYIGKGPYVDGSVDWAGKSSGIEIDPLKSIREMYYNFTGTDHFLAYPLEYSSNSWLPSTVNWGNPGERSHFIQDLLNSGYPKLPINGEPIPWTAYYGTVPGLAKKLAEKTFEIAYDICSGGIDNFSWLTSRTINFFASIVSGGTDWQACWEYLDDLRPLVINEMEILDLHWSAYSDFIVDLSSQTFDENFSNSVYPFQSRELQKKNASDLGVPHMDFALIGKNGGVLQGATSHGDEIAFAIDNPPIKPDVVGLNEAVVVQSSNIIYDPILYLTQEEPEYFWTYFWFPNILEIRPNAGFSNQTITIYGAHFPSIQDGIEVKFNGIPAEMIFSTENEIKVKVPQFNIAGKLDVQVKNLNTGMVSGSPDDNIDDNFILLTIVPLVIQPLLL